MTKCFLVFLGLIAVVVTAKTNGRIIGGNLARAGEFPWQAGVTLSTAEGSYFCGGTLITPQYVLIAAQCLYNGLLYMIQFGSTTLQSPDSNRVIVASATHTIHPNFDPYTLANDIGLIRLHEPLTLTTYIQPIGLATLGDISEGLVATVTGWGQTSDSISGTVNDLRYVNVAVISNSECSLTYGDQIKSSMICSLGNYNEGICTGDTGGPLIIEKSPNNWFQIGVGSFFSQKGCETLHPSGYTRVDLFTDWINSTISAQTSG